MKVSTENIETINKRLEYLIEHFNIQESTENIQIDDESIFIAYPGEWDEDNSEYAIEVFLDYTKNLESITVIDEHSVVCGNVRQTIIDVNSNYYEHRVPDIEFELDNISLQIVNNPFLIGIIASRDNRYNENFGVFPCSDYMAIELKYKEIPIDNEEQSIELIKKCLYYISSKYDVPISIGKFRKWEDITDEEVPEKKMVCESDLVSYSPAMDLYVKALTIENPDIRYLYFYKIIEYFSPIISKKHSYEKLNQRLDTLSIRGRNHEYLESIFKLTKQYEVSLKDSELASTVLSECVDIISLFSFLPNSIRNRLSKDHKFRIDDVDNIEEAKIIELKKDIGKMLYATRNGIVHAKSNYSNTGKECPNDDLEQLNTFMSLLCSCLIVWNGRQPTEYQLK